MIYVVVALALSFGIAELRWLRVAQREHYLAGSATRFAVRWWRCSPTNALLFAMMVVLVAATFAATFAAIGVLVIAVLAPVGLGVRGRTSKLAWTRRLRTLASSTALMFAVPVGAVLAGTSVDVAVRTGCVLLFFAPVCVDGALVILAPLERRLSDRYVARATRRLRQISPLVVAITGSYGKTTTKGYIAHLLSTRHSVVASPRSFNNRAGLARTVNESLIPGTEILVAEMGTYGRGEIREMCQWMRPSISVITAIGPVHLERFKDLSNTLAAKAEIAEFADHVVLNVDDERLVSLAGPLSVAGKSVITCSASDVDADVCVLATGDLIAVYSRGKLVAGDLVLPERSAPSLTNLACAIAVALVLGDRLADVVAELEGIPEPPNRLTLVTGESGVMILDDTFNANPAGAARALARLGEIGDPAGRRVLVTPGMIELGGVQEVENRRLARQASMICSDIVVVGRTNRRALRSGVTPQARLILAAYREEAVAWVKSNLGPGDAVLYENDLPDHYA